MLDTISTVATYKVLQDIEAEDKILGPLTLKQFIFAIIAIAVGFVQFQLLTSNGLGPLRFVFAFIFLPPFLIFGFLASPIGRDQPNDVWLLARLRFILKPHKRVWDQDGISQLVTITAPKTEDKQLTDNLSQTEVTSRLKALANTLDSRGWAVKNIDAQTYKQADFLNIVSVDSDRLISPGSLVGTVPSEIESVVDLLDESTSQVAQKLNTMVEQSEATHRQQIIQNMQQSRPTQTTQQSSDFWFNDPATTSQPAIPSAQPQSNVVAGQNRAYSPPQTSQTNSSNPAIINLAHNDDLNVETIARQARHIDEQDQEVVVPLR